MAITTVTFDNFLHAIISRFHFVDEHKEIDKKYPASRSVLIGEIITLCFPDDVSRAKFKKFISFLEDPCKSDITQFLNEIVKIRGILPISGDKYRLGWLPECVNNTYTWNGNNWVNGEEITFDDFLYAMLSRFHFLNREIKIPLLTDVDRRYYENGVLIDEISLLCFPEDNVSCEKFREFISFLEEPCSSDIIPFLTEIIKIRGTLPINRDKYKLEWLPKYVNHTYIWDGTRNDWVWCTE